MSRRAICGKVKEYNMLHEIMTADDAKFQCISGAPKKLMSSHKFPGILKRCLGIMQRRPIQGKMWKIGTEHEVTRADITDNHLVSKGEINLNSTKEELKTGKDTL